MEAVSGDQAANESDGESGQKQLPPFEFESVELEHACRLRLLVRFSDPAHALDERVDELPDLLGDADEHRLPFQDLRLVGEGRDDFLLARQPVGEGVRAEDLLQLARVDLLVVAELRERGLLAFVPVGLSARV